MIYCPECGSAVAPNDVFCQNCGIGLAANPILDVSVPALKENTFLNESEEPKISETVAAVAAQDEPVPVLTNEIENAFPSTPQLLTDDFEPQRAQVNELQDNLLSRQSVAEEEAETFRKDSEFTKKDEIPSPNMGLVGENQIVAQEPKISPEVFSPAVISDLSVERPPVEEEKIESTPILDDERLILPAEKIEFTPSLKVESPWVEAEKIEPSPIFEAEKQPLEAEKIESFPILKEEKPPESEVKVDSVEIEEVKNENPPHQVGENAVVFPKLEENEFNETLPYFSANLAKHKQNQDLFFEKKTEEQLFVTDSEAVKEHRLGAHDAGEPLKNEPEVVSPPVFSTPPVEPVLVTNFQAPLKETVNQEKREFTPLFEEKKEVTPVFEAPVEKPISVSESEAAEARSFTNPNIAVGIDTDGRSKAKLKPLEEGTVLNGRYEIVRKIGGGGMGAVYLASDKNLGGVLRAVKEMVQSYIEESQQEKAINDFKRESLLLTSLEHPTIPTIFDYFFDEKEARFYLVMKYISGGDLSGRMRAAPEGRIDEVTVTDWAIQIADVLEYLHRHEPPIVYRDLKPSNIMIDGNSGRVMLIDFGIARWVNKEEKGVTAVGTMGYAPPELFSGNVEPRSDIYSLGSTMFHLLTGADPQSNPLLIFDFNKNPRPRQINPSLSDQMEQILMRSVEYSSAHRFGSAAEMRDSLIKHKENLLKGAVTFGVSVQSGGMPLAGNLPVFCGFCGQRIVATDMFCPFCGAQQPLTDQSQKLQTPQSYPPPRLTARLRLIGTNELDQMEYNLDKENSLVGRRDPMSNIFPEVDLSKFDPQTKISRKHARIWRENDIFMLEDLGSSNGTILISGTKESNRLLPRQPHVLAHGDKIRIGDTVLQFTIG